MRFPKTLQEFQASFPDEESCWQALRCARWPRGFVCPRCGSRRSSWIETRALEQCVRCRYQCSVTAGTVFHRTRVPLQTWFWAIFFLARHKKGISALQLQRDTGIGSYQTAWTLLHKLRSALGPRPGKLLTGLVELDESYVGGHERGRRGGRQVLHKSIVAGAVEQRAHTAGRVRLGVLAGVRFQEDLAPFVQGAIDAERATVRTGGFPAYFGLPFRSSASATTAGSRVPIGPIRARSCPGFTGCSEISRRGCAAPSTGSAASTCRATSEFSYRFDRRWREGELFGFVLQRAAQGEPLPYHRLVAEAAG